MRPNFLFIGPDKSGSTWIYELLKAHPQCFLPVVKDIYFFDRYYDRGLEWYFSFFEGAPKNVQVIGELSHDYLFSPSAAKRIFRDLQKVKLITCLRNPVERCFSHYLYLIKSGLTSLPFEAALEKFSELKDNSCYYSHLKFYFSIFNPNQIKVLYFDDLQMDPFVFATSIYKFLNIEFNPQFNYRKKILPASRPRNRWTSLLLKKGANISRDLGHPQIVGIIKNNKTINHFFFTTVVEKPFIPEETIKKLKHFFYGDIKNLEKLLDIDLGHWY